MEAGEVITYTYYAQVDTSKLPVIDNLGNTADYVNATDGKTYDAEKLVGN